jgi:molybdopterin-synthase adenylyltransferase
LFLGSAGVGELVVVDHDVVDATNLQRQIAHNLARIGQPKAESLHAAIAALNPDVRVTPVTQRADAALLDTLVAQADVVLDCTDNFSTRHAINRACVSQGKPLVSGAAIRFDGQLSVYDSRSTTAPCYACVFPDTSGVEETRCATMGVFAPLVGIIGTMQAAEALKIASGIGSQLVGRLLMLDGRRMEWTDIRLPRQPTCLVCGA